MDRRHGREPYDLSIEMRDAEWASAADNLMLAALQRSQARHLWHPREAQFDRNIKLFLEQTTEELATAGWPQYEAEIEAQRRRLLIHEAERLIARLVCQAYISQKASPNHPRNKAAKKDLMTVVAEYGTLLDPGWHVAIDEALEGEPLDLSHPDADLTTMSANRAVEGLIAAMSGIWLREIVYAKPPTFDEATPAEQEVWHLFLRVMVEGPLAMHAQRLHDLGSYALNDANATLVNMVRTEYIDQTQANEIAQGFMRIAQAADRDIK